MNDASEKDMNVSIIIWIFKNHHLIAPPKSVPHSLTSPQPPAMFTRSKKKTPRPDDENIVGGKRPRSTA